MSRFPLVVAFAASVSAFAGCGGEAATMPTPIPAPTATVVPVDPLSVVNAYYAAFNAGDIAALSALLANDIEFTFGDLQLSGRVAVLANRLVSINEDAQITLSDPVVNGDTVVGKHSISASRLGEMTGTTEIVVSGAVIASIRVTQAPEGQAAASRRGVVLTDPSFEALEGATAHFGELEGALYQIEIPTNWNGRLVLWAHGARQRAEPVRVNPPPFREYLIENGYAWAASSFSFNGDVMFQAAHETAALHDFFAREFGKPEYVYITGNSMGAHITLLSLELFPDRYDGALAACSVAGLATLDYPGHYVALGAYAAGVTQEEFETAESGQTLVQARILATFESDPKTRNLFESLIATLTGGPRPFRHEGFESLFGLNFALTDNLIKRHSMFDNTDFVYEVDPAAGVSAEDVNNGVIRIVGDPRVRNGDPNFTFLTGAVPVPLLMMHTTGDAGAPFSGMQSFRRAADAAGNGDMLVTRAIRAAFHCEFSEQEMNAALEDLFNWVENGVKPEGEDILGPLEDIGLKFTNPLRPGDPGGL